MNRVPFSHINYTPARYVSFESVSRNRVHRHSFYEPCIVISGNGVFEHGARTYQLQSGDLFIADREVDHEIRSEKTRDLRLFFLRFHVVTVQGRGGEGAHALWDPSSTANFVADHRTHLAGQSHLIPLFEHVVQLVRRDPDFLASRNYHDATVLLLRQIVTALTQSASLSETDYSAFRQRRRVEEFIEANLHSRMRVKEIAEACAVSERTLRRRWSTWSKRSLAEEITYRRIERAAQLLLLPDIAVSDVGFQVGISSPAQFSRQFRIAKGCTPRDYRNRYRDELQRGLPGQPGRDTVFRDDESK